MWFLSRKRTEKQKELKSVRADIEKSLSSTTKRTSVAAKKASRIDQIMKDNPRSTEFIFIATGGDRR